MYALMLIVFYQSFRRMPLMASEGHEEFAANQWPGTKGSDWCMKEESQVKWQVAQNTFLLLIAQSSKSKMHQFLKLCKIYLFYSLSLWIHFSAKQLFIIIIMVLQLLKLCGIYFIKWTFGYYCLPIKLFLILFL